MRPWFFLILSLVILTGCSDHASSPMNEAAMSVPAPSLGGAPMLKSAAQVAGPTVGGGTADANRPAAHGRMIIRSADVRIVAADPAAAMRNIGGQVEAQGGFVSDSKQWIDDGKPHATLTLRVPAALLTPTLAQIRKQALRTESENVTGQDVSQEYTDLSAQLTNLQATEVQLRELLVTVRQKTQRAADVLDVFNQLSEVRGKIDQTKGRLLDMGQLVDLATITLDIAPDIVATPAPVEAWHPTGVAADALHTLGATLQALCNILIWLCLYIAPLVLIIGLPSYYIRRAYQNSKGNGGRKEE